MKVHHLNCGTMCPLAQRMVEGSGSLFKRGRMVCHCLLVETDDGLVLIDTGVGLGDIRPRDDGKRGYGKLEDALLGPVFDEDETAWAQVQRLGFVPEDVRHIVVTHLDIDHAGGLNDFPWATVHVHSKEHNAALRSQARRYKKRYQRRQFADLHWERYDEFGDAWFGFEAVKPLAQLGDDILIVPLTGHSPGHSGVAVRHDGSWLLHCGDAYFDRREVHPEDPSCPPGLKLFQRVLSDDNDARLRNTKNLRRLASDHGHEVSLICAHDAVTYQKWAG